MKNIGYYFWSSTLYLSENYNKQCAYAYLYASTMIIWMNCEVKNIKCKCFYKL